MRKYPVLTAVIVAGIFSVGSAAVTFPASDNTAQPPKFDHRSVGKDPKECVKCHKVPEPAQK